MHNKLIAMAAAMLFSGSLLLAGGTKEKVPEAKELTLYTTSSFAGEWGPGPKIAKDFEKKTGIKVNLVDAGSTGEMVSRLVSEKDNPRADVVIGIPDSLASKIYEADILDSYESPMLSQIPDFLQFDPQNRLLPYDYGNFAFVYDSEMLTEEDLPHSLEDLLDKKYAEKVILIDPRTSAVGMGLLLWTIEVYGEEHYLDWWKQMKPNTLTISSGWSSGYGLFTEGEAPLVISYTTSPVYHVMYENTTRYKALLFSEGHSTTVEGMGIVKESHHLKEAKELVDYVLGDAQAFIATTNSMYPANSTCALPQAFEYAPKPQESLMLDAKEIEQKQDLWLDAWEEAMQGK